MARFVVKAVCWIFGSTMARFALYFGIIFSTTMAVIWAYIWLAGNGMLWLAIPELIGGMCVLVGIQSPLIDFLREKDTDPADEG